MSGSETGPSGPNDPVEPSGKPIRAPAPSVGAAVYVSAELRGAHLEDALAEGGEVVPVAPGERPADPRARWEKPSPDLEEQHE
jgi:hypothetical protein